LHGIEVLGILRGSFRESRHGLGHLVLLVEHHAPEIFHTGRLRLFRSQGVEFRQGVIQIAFVSKFLRLNQRP
jgi:hypothetical protein